MIDIEIDSDDADLISQEDQMQAIQALQSGMAKFANRTSREVIANRNEKGESKSKKAKKKQKETTPDNKNIQDPKKITKLAPGFSEWFNGEARAHWKRPCFNGFQTVVMGDSQLKIYGQNNKRRAGFSITSYSGCDVSSLQNGTSFLDPSNFNSRFDFLFKRVFRYFDLRWAPPKNFSSYV